MKTRFLQMLFIFSGLMLWSCTTDPAELITPEVVIEAENPDYAIIRSLGFSTKDIIDTGDTYIVEGDVLFDKKDIQNLVPETRQTRTQYLVSESNVKNIKVYITPELNTSGASWYNAVLECLNEWNNIPNCQVQFIQTTTSSGANVTVQRYKGSAMPSNTIAWAYLPTKDGKAGTPVEISPNYDYYNADQKKFVMVHEFGHVLGLGHTDDRSLALIPGTPVNDYYSVMQSATGGLPWSLFPFSNSDIAAIQALYGIPVWSMLIDGPSTYSFSPPSIYTLNVGTNLIDQSVLWYVNGAQQTCTSFTISPTFTQSGSNTLKARINYGGNYYEANKVITVPVIPKAPEVTPIKGPIKLLYGGWAYFYANISNYDANTSVNWTIQTNQNPVPIIVNSGICSIQIDFPNKNADYTIILDVTNPYGTTTLRHYIATGDYDIM